MAITSEHDSDSDATEVREVDAHEWYLWELPIFWVCKSYKSTKDIAVNATINGAEI